MDEENTPARRGRPRGTGIDDTPTLAEVADILLASPGMRPTTAMKRAVRGVEATQLRRLQEKWRVHGGRLLAEARERGRLKQEAVAKSVAARAAHSRHDQSTAWRDAMGMVDHEAIKSALGHMDLPALKAMHVEHAAMAGMVSHQLGDIGGIKKLMDLMDPPALKALRQTMELPALRQMRALQETLERLDPLRRRR